MARQTQAASQHEALTLSPRDAARVLGISQRTLWTHTRSGSVPHVRLGRRILYPIADLKQWLRDTMHMPAR